MAGSFVASGVPSYQVFLNFRGEELRHNFISHLAKALRDKDINIFIDENAEKGQNLNILLNKIEESEIALAIFSPRYTESTWCLNELVKIKERMDEKKLVTIPIFYKVGPDTVKHQKGAFGDALRENVADESDDLMRKWKGALKSVAQLIGFPFDGNSNENMFIDYIVQGVVRALRKISLEKSTRRRSSDHSQNTEVHSREAETEKHGLNQRVNELNDKVQIEKEETRIVGVVGMHGIGKTTLVEKFYKKWKRRFLSRGLLKDISDIVKFDASGLNSNLPGMLLKKLLKYHDVDEERYEVYKEELLKHKVLIVLDGVNSKRQIQVLLEGHHEWILKGSKILIATSDQSLLHDLVDDIYVVPQLDYREGLKHFHHHAFDPCCAHEKDDKETFMKLCEEFVHYVRGHPLTLQLLGEELRGQNVAYWKEKLESLALSPSQSIRDRVLQVSYDELSQEQKDAFLDIACFRSHDLFYVKSVLDSSSGSQETNIIKALADKFLINISDSSRVEMHDLLYTFATETDSKADVKGRHQRNITKGPNGNIKARGIFIDLFQMNKERPLGKEHFKKMRDLRYLKLYSSHCSQECNPDHKVQKINLPDKLDFPLEEVRCLHWLKYPLDELPHNFNPKNLVDLKLPYSQVEQIWDHKDAPKLKWVDLNHSRKLKTLSGLSKVQKLQRMNLEGCTALETVDPELQSMENLVFLNLKGCTALESFLDTENVPLKTLILSNCSKLKKFLVVSDTLEALYLDGTAITELPTTMERLVILSVKDCKLLAKLPQGFDMFKDLQELVCSGCSILSILPDEMENMNFLQILLLDGTEVTKIPKISSLERLSLSGNDRIICLPENISLLSKLKWLDLKYCAKLLSIPELPPNLHYLDAHGCESLKKVANPLATHLPTEQIHSTFIFTNCHELDRTAKEEITAYAQRKCQLLSAALKRCSEGFVPEALFSTCFPGCDVPSWFCHEAVGSVLNLTLSPHWNENRFVGIALCAVLSFPNSQEHIINSFSVTCKFNLKIKDGPGISFDRLVGTWNRHGKKSEKMASDHVFICYIRCSNSIKCLEDQQRLGACTPTTASLEFGVTDENARVEVLKCGLRLVYASDEPQRTNSDVTANRGNSDASSTPVRNGSFTSTTIDNVSPTGSNGAFLQSDPSGR